MIKFLMVHTVFKKRQYDFINYDERKEEFMQFLHNLRNRNNMLLFPAMNNEDIRNLPPFYTDDVCEMPHRAEKYLKPVREDANQLNPTQKVVAIMNFDGSVSQLRMIESIGKGVYKFHTDDYRIISDSVVPIMMAKSDIKK